MVAAPAEAAPAPPRPGENPQQVLVRKLLELGIGPASPNELREQRGILRGVLEPQNQILVGLRPAKIGAIPTWSIPATFLMCST